MRTFIKYLTKTFYILPLIVFAIHIELIYWMYESLYIFDNQTYNIMLKIISMLGVAYIFLYAIVCVNKNLDEEFNKDIDIE